MAGSSCTGMLPNLCHSEGLLWVCTATVPLLCGVSALRLPCSWWEKVAVPLSMPSIPLEPAILALGVYSGCGDRKTACPSTPGADQARAVRS